MCDYSVYVASILTYTQIHTGKMGENPSLGLLFQMRSSQREAAREQEQEQEQRRAGAHCHPFHECIPSGVKVGSAFPTLGVTNDILPQSR